MPSHYLTEEDGGDDAPNPLLYDRVAADANHYGYASKAGAAGDENHYGYAKVGATAPGYPLIDD